MAFTETTLKVSETQNSLIKQLKKDNASHTSTYAYMKNTVDNLAHDVRNINPKDPNLYSRLEKLMNKMITAFNKWLIHGNNKVGKVDKTTDKLKNNINLI